MSQRNVGIHYSFSKQIENNVLFSHFLGNIYVYCILLAWYQNILIPLHKNFTHTLFKSRFFKIYVMYNLQIARNIPVIKISDLDFMRINVFRIILIIYMFVIKENLNSIFFLGVQ